MTPPVEQCAAHSGVERAIEGLECFQGRQEGTGGVNERIFDRLDRINAKLNWMLGGSVGVGFVLGLLASGIKLH